MELEIDLLGTMQVRADAHDARVRGDYPKAILARLALSAGEFVATEELVSDVWADRPEQVLSTLRAHVSRMRGAFLGDAVVGGRGGYLLDVPPSRVDLLRLRARCEAAVSADAPRRLSELLSADAALARPALVGLEAHPFVERLRADIADERRLLEEDLGELALDLGDPGLATATLADTVVRHPLHERPVRLLATALARSARTRDAVSAIDAFQERLGTRSGLRVSARLEGLRAAIVRLDPEVVASAGAPATRRVGVAIPLTRFVGRERDLSELQRLAHTERLVTLVGPAGVGKTRLAVEVARRSVVDEEQFMVDLADVVDPADVVATIADVVRVPEPTVDAIATRFRDARALLVLDNADRVIGALAVAVDAILRATTRLRIIVTSREALRAGAEHAFVVRPLERDSADEAWQLFAERAADARGGRGFDESELADAQALCGSLEGIPLAIELATARLDVLGVAEVRAGVGASFASAGRHSSVHAALAWSVDLLDPRDRSALVALARFAGAFTIAAVAGVCEVTTQEASTLVERLVGKSLVAVDRSASGRRRYRVLESMRDFLEPWDDADGAEMWRTRHRLWFADFVEKLAPSLRTFSSRDTMSVLDGFRADLAAASASSIASGDRASAVKIAGSLAHYWYLRGVLAEGRRRIVQALAVPGPVDDAREAVAQLELANLAYQVGDAPAAFAAVAAALAQATAAGDPSVQVVALARAGYGRSLFGDVDEGAALMRRAEALLPDAAPWARSEYRMAAGQLRRAQGQFDEALIESTEAHRIAASIGYTWMVTSALYVTTKCLVDARRAREAIAVGRSAVVTARADEDAAGALALLHAIAGATASVERHEEGARLLGAVDALGARYDYSTMTAEGADAERLRSMVNAGLRPGEFEREYSAGSRLDWSDVMTLVDALPGARGERRWGEV